MRLPFLTYQPQKNQKVTSAFRGLNQKLIAGEGEFAAMKNMCSDHYPAISTRPQRGTTDRSFKNPYGMIYKNGLFIVYARDSSSAVCSYNGEVVSGLSLTLTKKILVGMGAYILIFPDKKAFNTSTKEVKNLESSLTQNGSMKFEAVSDDSAFTKITYTGIGNVFNKYDAVKISGCNETDLNETKIISDSSTNYLVTTYAVTKTVKQTTSASVTYDASKQCVYISFTGIGDTVKKNDLIKVSGSTGGVIDGSYKVAGSLPNVIEIPHTQITTYTQESGLFIRRYGFEQASGITMKREVPDFDFAVEQDNRIWACSSANHEIYASKLGDPFNWNCFEGISTDSYALTVGSDGDFTGIAAHLGYVIFFKEGTIHVMYGDKPSNYSLNTKNLPGVMKGCENSVTVINERLFYVGREGIYAYDGSVPAKISDPITASITVASGNQQDDKYYLSCKMDGVQSLLVYDPKNNIFDAEDGTVFLYSAYGEGKLYYIDSDKKLKTIKGNDTERISWMIETADMTESSIDEKYISKIKLNLWMDLGAYIDIYLKTDDEDWKRYGTVRSTKNTTYNIPVIPQRCNKYRLKIEGTGSCKILGISRTVEGGSELNGSLQLGYRK